MQSNNQMLTKDDSSQMEMDESLLDCPTLRTSYRSSSPVSYISSSSEDDFIINDTKIKEKHTFLPVDPSVLKDLEEQAKIAGRSIEKMMKYLAKHLQDSTQITQGTASIYRDSVRNVQKDVENNIRLMYSLVAKCEELDQKMKPVTELAKQVSDIKESLDALEQFCQ